MTDGASESGPSLEQWRARYEATGHKVVERAAAGPPERTVYDRFEPPLATLRCLTGGPGRAPSVRWVHAGDADPALEAELVPVARASLESLAPVMRSDSAVLLVVFASDRRPSTIVGPHGAPPDALVPPSVLVNATLAFLDGGTAPP